jgi:hypothetical protein
MFNQDENPANKKEMLLNLKELLDSESIILNSEKHSNLVLALRTATATDMILDKQKMSNSDILDAMTLAVRRVSLNYKEVQHYDFR